jgi:hypothetical protein
MTGGALAMKSSIAEFRAAFEALGYRRTLDYEVFGKSDRWYVFDGSAPAATHVAYLAYRPALRAYAPQFGMFNVVSQARLVAALPSIFPYLHPTFRNGIWPLDRRPCWTLFDAAQKLGWISMCVPDPRAPEDWPARLDEMVNKLLRPTFWSIDTPDGIEALLLRKEKKFEWAVKYAVLRAAEVVALSKHLSREESVIRENLTEHKSNIVRNMYGSKDFNEMLNTFLPHAVQRRPQYSFAYDNNGNQISGANATYVYTSCNKPQSISRGAVTVLFADDADHQPVGRISAA